MMMGEKDTRSSTPTGTRGNGEIQDSSSRRELLDMDMDGEQSSSSWRLDVKQFTVPQQRPPSDHHLLHHRFRRLLRYPRKQGKIAEYYKKQEILLEGFTEMETMNESGCLAGNPTEDEMKQLAKSERTAIYVSNVANLVLFVAKVYASYESRSLAVIASTLDSLLDLLSGFILWFTSHAMKKPNLYHYPIGKKRMQPVGIIVFASVMATLGLQILIESGRQLVAKTAPERNLSKEKWMIGIMVSVTFVKFALMVYCRRFKNEIVVRPIEHQKSITHKNTTIFTWFGNCLRPRRAITIEFFPEGDYTHTSPSLSIELSNLTDYTPKSVVVVSGIYPSSSPQFINN